MYYLLLLFPFLSCYVQGVNSSEHTFNNYVLDYIQKASITENITEPCRTHLDAYLDGISNGETWALEMLDATGRIPLGLMKGNMIDLGLYDECVNIDHKLENETIKGRYCYAGLSIPLSTITASKIERNYKLKYKNTNLPPIAAIALCLPNGCYPKNIFNELGTDNLCVTKDEKHLDGSDVACVAFLGVILFYMALSTTYDIYRQKTGNKYVHPLLLAFSVYTNGQKMLTISHDMGQILCFNGLKVFSMLWVITGHRFIMTRETGALQNPSDTEEWMQKWYSPYILMAPLSVDLFLFISGTLLSYGFIKMMRKPHPRFNVLLYYLHRYLRLTPALAVVFFTQITIQRKIGSGPMYDAVQKSFSQNCRKNWWRVFLYIQNYFKVDEMCLFHTWYLSMDLQCYLLSPLILLPILKYPKLMSNYVLPFVIAVSIICPMVIIYVNEIEYWTDDFYTLYYYLTHTRLAPWLIGIAFGAFALPNAQNKTNIFVRNQFYNLLAWAMFFGVIAVLFFCHNEVVFNNPTRLKTSLYMALQGPAWTVCLCWLSYACVHGHGGPINSFLSYSLFQPLSKITYSVYLVHFGLLTMDLGSARTLMYFNDYTAIRAVSGDIMFSIALGAFWALAFESPMITIEKYIFGAGGKTNTTTSKIDDGPRRENRISPTLLDSPETIIVSTENAVVATK